MRADRDEILQCLIQTNLKLQEYDQERTNFLARAIHDFRAPLTALCGYSSLLLGNNLGPLTEDHEGSAATHELQREAPVPDGQRHVQLSVGQYVDTKPEFPEG